MSRPDHGRGNVASTLAQLEDHARPLRSAAWRARGRAVLRFAGCGFHELPRSAECNREAPNQYEGEIIDEIDIMGMQNERYGQAQFGPIGDQAQSENEIVPCAGMTQMQSQRVIQAEDRHDRRTPSNGVAWNESEHGDEERVDEPGEAARSESSGRRLGMRTHDLPRFQRDDDEEQADERTGSLRRCVKKA